MTRHLAAGLALAAFSASSHANVKVRIRRVRRAHELVGRPGQFRGPRLHPLSLSPACETRYESHRDDDGNTVSRNETYCNGVREHQHQNH